MENKDLTLGFKVLSAYHLGAISKDDLAKLSKKNINWGSTELENNINLMKEQLLCSNFFKYWSEWDRSLMDLTSQAVAINFLILALKYWEKKNKPTNRTATEHIDFLRNAHRLFDRCLYEYITNQWKGSSDSKIKKNLESENFSSNFNSIEKEKWENLLDEMFDGKISGTPYSHKKTVDNKVKLLLIYYYSLNEISRPGDNVNNIYDFDHIIPKSELLSGDVYSKSNVSNILNICTLSKSDNCNKSDRRLIDINSQTENILVKQIEKYSKINKGDFRSYSGYADLKKLFEYRKNCIRSNFIEKRSDYI